MTFRFSIEPALRLRFCCWLTRYINVLSTQRARQHRLLNLLSRVTQ